MTKFTCFELGIIVKIGENLLSAFSYSKPITQQSFLSTPQQDCPSAG